MEATKFTEVGYVGRDVDSMIRDLVEESIRMVKVEKIEEVYEKSEKIANERILDILFPLPSKKRGSNPLEALFSTEKEEDEKTITEKELIMNKRKEVREKLLKGELENEVIEIDVEDNHNSTIELFSGLGMEEYNINMEDIFGDFLPKKTKKKRVTIEEARKII